MLITYAGSILVGSGQVSLKFSIYCYDKLSIECKVNAADSHFLDKAFKKNSNLNEILFANYYFVQSVIQTLICLCQYMALACVKVRPRSSLGCMNLPPLGLIRQI